MEERKNSTPSSSMSRGPEGTWRENAGTNAKS